MKNTYLVSYDVMAPQRLHHVFKTLQGFGEHIQYSVFICNLTPKDKIILIEKLRDALNLNEDRVMIVNLGPSDGTANERVEIIGNQAAPPEEKSLII